MRGKMNKTVYKSRATRVVILLVAVLLLIGIWPLRIFKQQITTSVGTDESDTLQVETVNDENMVMQVFAAQYDHLDAVRVFVSDEYYGSDFFVRILDKDWQQLCEEEVSIDPQILPGFVDVEIDVNMEVNSLYYLILQGDESQIQTALVPVQLTDLPFLGECYYQDSTMEGVSLAADYIYSVPLRKVEAGVSALAVLAAAALLLFLVKKIYEKKTDRLITAEEAFRNVMNPVVIVLAAAALIAIELGVFGHYLLDNSVFFISVLFLTAILLYGINHKRDGQPAVVTADYCKSHLADLLQSVCIAGAIAACCEYMSGLYDIHHAVAERKEMLWFALSIIVMFEWKELVNLYNFVYLIAAGIFGYRYFAAHVTEDMDDANRQVLRYTVCIAILLGLILIRTIIGLCRKKLAKPCIWYSALLLVFFALIMIFRNTRWWSVTMAVAFTLFYLNYGMWTHRERLLTNILRGAVLQFVLATGYCLLHRPYVTYRNARYTHIFHTVTITATYLTMMECVALVLLLSKLTKTRKLRDIWKELCFFGVVSAYMIFTMARTAYFAVAVAVLFGLVLIAAGKGKERVHNILKNLGLLAASVLVLLPVTFTLQRNIPAMVSDPYLYEIEYSMYCPEDVMRGHHTDSKNFMRVGRFIDVFGEKILGLPEGTFDIYGEIAEYQRTHNVQQSAGNETTDESQQLFADGADTADEIAAVGNAADGAQQLLASASLKDSDLTELFAAAGTEATDMTPVSETDILLADAEDASEESTDEEPPEDTDQDYTNGRISIFRSYIEQLNLTGHDTMGATLENGEIATHAHNIYLQVAYDHGIIVGIVFILVGGATLVAAFLFYRRRKGEIAYVALPAVITVAVAVAGLVEWIYHLSSPCGYLLMLVITPLLFEAGEGEGRHLHANDLNQDRASHSNAPTPQCSDSCENTGKGIS